MTDKKSDHRPQGSVEFHAEQAQHYESLQGELGLEQDAAWQNDAWQGYALEILYHRLCQAADEYLPTAINEFVPALVASNPPDFGLGLQWAKTILKAGEATDNSAAKEWGEQLAKVWEAFPQRRWQDMADVWTALIEYSDLKDQKRATVLGWRSSAYQQLQQLDSALADADRIVELDPTNEQAFFQRSWVYRGSGWAEKALADANRGLELSPENAFGYHARALVHFFMEHYEEALADAARSDELGHIFAIDTQAAVYTETGRYDEAVAVWTTAIGRNARNDWPPTMRGITYRRMGKYEEALPDLNRTIELNPYPMVLWARALLYQAMGQMEKAEADFHAAIELGQQAQSKLSRAKDRLCLAIFLLGVDQTDEAKSLCRKAISGEVSPYLVGWIIRQLDDFLSVFSGHTGAQEVQGILQQYLQEIGFDPATTSG